MVAIHGVAAVFHSPIANVGPVMLLPVVGVLAYVQTYRRTLSPAYVAAVMDRAWGLDEQLATAGELAFSDRGDLPAAQACYAQLASTIEPLDPAATGIRQRTIARQGALAGLLLLACLATTVWSAMRANERHAAANRRPAAEYAAMAEALGTTLRAEELTPHLRQQFEQMLLEAEQMDEAAIQERLAELRRQGYTIIEFDAPSLLAAAGVSQETIDELVPSEVLPTDVGPGDVALPLPDERVRVYAPGQPGATTSPAEELGEYFDDAWSAAQRRAATQVDTGNVPPEYRGMVRAYFDLAK